MSYPQTIPHVDEVEVLEPYTLRLRFDDGLIREIDFEAQLHGRVFGPLRDRELFSRVRVDYEAGTITWPNQADFDPVILHGEEDPGVGPPLKVMREHQGPAPPRRAP